MKTLRYLKNPNRRSIVLKEFHFGQMYFDTLACVISKDEVLFEVPRNFGGAVVEYFGSRDGTGDDEYLIEKSIVHLTGFNHYFLVRKLDEPVLSKTDMLLNVRYDLCKTRWDFVTALASKLTTIIPTSAFSDGLHELPTYSISEPSRCAVLIRDKKIVDFHYGSGNNTPVLFGISKDGNSIRFSVNRPKQRAEVPVDEKPALALQSQYV